MFVCLSACTPACSLVWLFCFVRWFVCVNSVVCVFVYLFVCVVVCWRVSLFVCLPVCACISLSVSVSVCVRSFVCLLALFGVLLAWLLACLFVWDVRVSVFCLRVLVCMFACRYSCVACLLACSRVSL